MTDPLGPGDVAALERCLDSGGVAVVPTDTVYGLACDPGCPAAIRRMHALKGRTESRPAGVMFYSLDAAAGLIDRVGPHTRAALATMLPGPLTVILADPAGSWAAAGGGGSVGLRVPRLAPSLAALSALRRPLLQTSANPTGGSDAGRVEELDSSIRSRVELVLEGGPLAGVASTVVDLREYEKSGRWSVLRAGAVSAETLAHALGPPSSAAARGAPDPLLPSGSRPRRGASP